MAGATFSGTVNLGSEWVAVVAVDAHDCQRQDQTRAPTKTHRERAAGGYDSRKKETERGHFGRRSRFNRRAKPPDLQPKRNHNAREPRAPANNSCDASADDRFCNRAAKNNPFVHMPLLLGHCPQQRSHWKSKPSKPMRKTILRAKWLCDRSRLLPYMSKVRCDGAISKSRRTNSNQT